MSGPPRALLRSASYTWGWGRRAFLGSLFPAWVGKGSFSLWRKATSSPSHPDRYPSLEPLET